MEHHILEICGLTRSLPISHVSKKTRLASFSILGDVELVDKLADDFANKLKNEKIDYIIDNSIRNENHKKMSFLKIVKKYITKKIRSLYK